MVHAGWFESTNAMNSIIEVIIPNIENPYELEIELNTIPGVLENGIFAGTTDKVIVGKESGNEVIEK